MDTADDITSYPEDDLDISLNSDRIRTLQEFGVPAEEILEIDRRLTQQEKDEVSHNSLIFYQPEA
ncbi:MAG: hypothetical protein DI553_00485 [Cutibacterium acnes]|nr:MAG: hypothetical protein DI553_00485 [Cutibacterium acnes]